MIKPLKCDGFDPGYIYVCVCNNVEWLHTTGKAGERLCSFKQQNTSLAVSIAFLLYLKIVNMDNIDEISCPSL